MFCRGLAVLFVITGAACADFQKSSAKKTENVVKVTAKADKAASDGTQTVTITVKIDSPFHIYANPVGNSDFESAATTLTFTGADAVKIEYPKGKTIKDKTLGDYNVLEGEIKITAKIKPKAGATVESSIKCQACDDNKCLLSSTIKTKVETP